MCLRNNPIWFVHFSEGQKNVLLFTQQCLHTKSVLFAHILITGRKDQLTKSIVDTTLADRTDPWTKRVQSILEEVGIQDLKNISKSMLKRRRMREHHVSQLRQAKAGHSSL